MKIYAALGNFYLKILRMKFRNCKTPRMSSISRAPQVREPIGA